MCRSTSRTRFGKFSASLYTGTIRLSDSGETPPPPGERGTQRAVLSPFPGWEGGWGVRSPPMLNHPQLDLLGNPRHHLVEDLRERGARLEPEQPLHLGHVRDAALHVVAERPVGDVAERLRLAVYLTPDQFGQLQHVR